jgi:hypothetical protein
MEKKPKTDRSFFVVNQIPHLNKKNRITWLKKCSKLLTAIYITGLQLFHYGSDQWLPQVKALRNFVNRQLPPGNLI